MKSSVVRWAVSPLLLLVVLNVAQVVCSSNGTSIKICHQQFHMQPEPHSLSTLQTTTVQIAAFGRPISTKEDERLTGAYTLSESLPEQHEEQNRFPVITSARFTATQKKYNRPIKSIRVLSFEQLYNGRKSSSRLDGRRVSDFKRQFRSEVRDGFEKSRAKREFVTEGRRRLEKRMTQFIRISRIQVRDGSDIFLSKAESRSSLYRSVADYRSEFRDAFDRSDVWKYSRSEDRSNLNRRMSGPDKDSRNQPRNGDQGSDFRTKSRIQDGSSLNGEMTDFRSDSRVKVGGDLDKSAKVRKFRDMGRGSLRFRFQVRDGSRRSELWMGSRSEVRSGLNGRVVDLKRDDRNQVREAFARSESKRVTRSEGRGIVSSRKAYIRKEFRSQVRDVSESLESMRKFGHEGRSRFVRTETDLPVIRKQKNGIPGNYRNKIKINSILKMANSRRHRSQLPNSTEWIWYGLNKPKFQLDELGVGTSRIGLLVPRRGQISRWRANDYSSSKRLSNGGAGDHDIMDRSRIRRVEASKTNAVDTEIQRKITVRSTKRKITFHRNVRRTSKSKPHGKGTNFLGSQSRQNFPDSELAMSTDVSGTTFNEIHLTFPFVNLDHSDLQDMSLKYLQNQTNLRSELCSSLAIDRHLENCSSSNSLLSLNEHRLEGWFRKEDGGGGDHKNAALLAAAAVGLLSIGGAQSLIAARGRLMHVAS